MTVKDLIRFLDASGRGWEGTIEIGKGRVVPLRYQFNGVRYSHSLNSVGYGDGTTVSKVKIWEQ